MRIDVLDIPLRGRGSRFTLGPIVGWTKVSPEDFEYLSQFRWYQRSDGYVVRGDYSTGRLKIVRMHREIMGFPRMVDHKNHDRLDNRRENLRVSNSKDNNIHTMSTKNSSSKYRGVTWRKDRNKWIAQCAVGGKNKYLGSFDLEEDAANAVKIYLENDFDYREYDTCTG